MKDGVYEARFHRKGIDVEVSSKDLNKLKDKFIEKLNNKEKIDVEVQLVKQNNFAERLLYYYSRLYGKELKRGDSYDKAKRVKIIAIVDYDVDITKDIEKMETIWNLREKDRPEKILTNGIEFSIIELKKVKNTYRLNKDNKKAHWLMFLDDPNSKECEEIVEKNSKVKEAQIIIHKICGVKIDFGHESVEMI